MLPQAFQPQEAPGRHAHGKPGTDHDGKANCQEFARDRADVEECRSTGRHEEEREILKQTIGRDLEAARNPLQSQQEKEQEEHPDHSGGYGEMECAHDQFAKKLEADQQCHARQQPAARL